MKDYSHILTKITSTPWMITPDALATILDIFDAHLSGSLNEDQIRARLAAAGQRPTANMHSRQGKIGVIPIHGPIFPKANMMTEMSGATSMSQFQEQFRSFMADDSIGAVLLDVDSPGGMSDMIAEMSEEIRTGRDTKPVYSIANTSANSAAYSLASQATRMYATPSAQVGSVGTYMVHTDQSRRKEAQGVTETVIKAGRFKAVPLEPLTAEGHSYLQGFVNEINDQFIANVAQGRKVDEDYVRQNFGEGGIVSARKALESKMIDGIATFDSVVEMIGGEIQQAASSKSGISLAGLEMSTENPGLKQSYDADKEHSEPGTGLGGEPQPREAPETGDKAIEGGWRRDPPPVAYETEESAVNRAWLEDRAKALNIAFTAETSDDDLATAVAKQMDDIVVPLSAATEAATEQIAFEQQYPEQAAQLAALLENSRSLEAHTFSEGYARFEGSTKGFSTLMREKVEDAHRKVSSRTFSHEDLKTLLDAVAEGDSIVQYAEQGSSRSIESSDTPVASGDVASDRKQFAELVRAAMTQDNLTRQAAIAHVAEQHPDLARAYGVGHVKA